MEEEEYTLAEMSKRLKINYGRIERICRVGLLGVSGEKVRLDRWKSERGWVTSDAAVKLFRQRLNDPAFSPQSEDKRKESEG